MKNRNYEIIGAAFDLGSPYRGCARAPTVLREKNLMKWLKFAEKTGGTITDGGDVVGPREGDATTMPKNMPEFLAFSKELIQKLNESYEGGKVPVIIGGDHAISIPSVSAAAQFLKQSHGENAELGLIWVDAHCDMDTLETDDSGDIHGMPVSHLLGVGEETLCNMGGFQPKLKPENVAYIGLRDVYDSDRKMIKEKNITAFSAIDIEKQGIVQVCDQVFSQMADRTAGFVISFDIDAVDPMVAPGVQYPEPGGLSFREAFIIMEYAAEAQNLLSLEMVEINPDRDKEFATTRIALRLIKHALGAKLL